MTTVQQPAENLAWYALSPEVAARQMGVDPDDGLDAHEAERRLEEYGPNEVSAEPPPSMWAAIDWLGRRRLGRRPRGLPRRAHPPGGPAPARPGDLPVRWPAVDVRVLARKTVRVKAFRLGEALDWAVGQARAKGFAHVAVACEPTGPRWLQVQRLCAERGLPLVCIQPLVSHIAPLNRPIHS